MASNVDIKLNNVRVKKAWMVTSIGPTTDSTGRTSHSFISRRAILVVVVTVFVFLTACIVLPITLLLRGQDDSPARKEVLMEWSRWTVCSGTCGNGTQSRHRIGCHNNTIDHVDGDCNSTIYQTRACNNTSCLTNSSWTTWSTWSSCSVTCGGGCQSRDRVCSIPGSCKGVSQEVIDCNMVSCPVNLTCSNQTIDLSQYHMSAWRVKVLHNTYLTLEDCRSTDLEQVHELLLFVGRSDLKDYGKYEVIQINNTNKCARTSCKLTFSSPITKLSNLSTIPCEIIAQRLPSFEHVSLSNQCKLTCRPRNGSVGGIFALRAKTMSVDITSQIDVTGKGYRGGDGGGTVGGGGMGGETFSCLPQTSGKGGDTGQSGNGSGGAGDGYNNGGPGGYHAGGGGGDTYYIRPGTESNDDGAGGGGGGGHLSGGAGGGGGDGCSRTGGEGGTVSAKIGSFAGGGGESDCPGVKGHNTSPTPGGRDGTTKRGGKGGGRKMFPKNTTTADSNGYTEGGGGGGGGMQYGSLDFENRLSYGGGGGGGGGSALGFSGGSGGNGGGLVLLFVEHLTLEGKIKASGEPGQCSVRASKSGSATGVGGSGAGGSVVIFTKSLKGDPTGNIFVQGGDPLSGGQCAAAAAGGGGEGGIGRWIIKTDSTLLKSEDS